MNQGVMLLGIQTSQYDEVQPISASARNSIFSIPVPCRDGKTISIPETDSRLGIELMYLKTYKTNSIIL